MSIEIKDLAADLKTPVTNLKNWLRQTGYGSSGRDFRGATASLDRDEERAVREAHSRGELNRDRTRTDDVKTEVPAPDPGVSSADLEGLPVVVVDDAPHEARGKETYPIFQHEELLIWLADDRTPVDLRRACTRRIQELMAHGRANRTKGVKGKNRGWLRIPLGGNGGLQYYLWLTNQGETVGGQEEETKTLHGHVPPKSRLLRAVRHHDETKDLLWVGSWGDYTPLTAQHALAAREDGLADPLVDGQRAIVGDRMRVRVLVGQPGSGKTTSLQAAASSLSGRALYVTWSQDLAERAREWFAAFAPAELDIVVWTFRELLANVDPRRRIDADLPLPDAVDLLRIQLEPFAGQLGPWRRDSGIRAAELFAELHAHLIGGALPVTFRGRRACAEARLSDHDYTRMRTDLGEPAVKGALLALRKLEDDDVRRLFPGPVAAFERAHALQQGTLTLDPVAFAFDWVLVDEVQDLTLAEQWLLLDVAARSGRARGVNPGMIIAGDEAQTVRPTAFEFGPLSDLVVDRLDARTDRRQHELVENLRSPEAIVAVLDRARRVLYGSLPRAQRPRGRNEDRPNEVTLGRVMEVEPHGDDELRRVFEIFAAVPGEAVLVYPGALVPVGLKKLATEVGAVIWTSETIKGLEFRIVGVLDVPDEVRRIEALVKSATRERFAVELARTAMDRFLVALSRTTETLVLIGEGWEPSGALGQILLSSGIEVSASGAAEDVPREGFLGAVGVSELGALLEVDAVDAVSQVDSLIAQSERLGALAEHLSAVQLAGNAVGLLGQAGRPGAAGRDLRRRAQRRLGQAQVLAALTLDQFAMLTPAARAFRAADAKETASTITALNRALTKSLAESDTCKQLASVAAAIPQLVENEPALVEPVVARLRGHAETLASSAVVPTDPAGRSAAVSALATLAMNAPSDRDAFRAAHQALLGRVLQFVGAFSEKPRRAEYAALRDGLDDAALLVVLDAAHAEACGDFEQATALFEKAGRLPDALRCARGAHDFVTAARLAAASRSDDADVLSWASDLAALVGRKPTGLLDPTEVDALRASFDRALGGRRELPRARGAARGGHG